jgi:hypothetical protein
MSSSKRVFVFTLLSLASGALFPAYAQKIEFQLCEEIKIDKTQIGAQIIETATCTKPSNSFTPKGTLRNIFMVASFPPVPTGAALAFKITKDNADGEYVHTVYYTVTGHHKTAWAEATINAPGKYFVQMMNYYPPHQVWGTAAFTVGEDKVGPRAVGNTAAGQGKVSICKEIDDNWKCVGESSQWQANVPFNVLFENPTPVGIDFIGIIFHKQGADGKDVGFVNEYQQNIGEENRKYATVGDSLRLPAGVYSVYVIAWGKREVYEHRGNLTEYFARTTLTVK